MRAVQVLRAPSSGAPTRMLSAVAAAMPPDEVARMLAALPGNTGTGAGWVLRLVDVEPGANMGYYLRRWEGEYVLTPGPGSGSSAPSTYLVTFAREAAFHDCCSTLGGGVRGVFRTQVERLAASGSNSASAPASTHEGAAQPRAGWTVLRSNRKTPSGAASGAGGSGSGGPSAGAVRSALAADAWGEDTSERRQPSAGTGSIGAAAGATAFAKPGGGSEPQLPGRGPKLDLAKETKWSALEAEEGEEEVEEAMAGGGESAAAESAHQAASSTRIGLAQTSDDLPTWDED